MTEQLRPIKTGQQRAADRLAAIDAANATRYANTPPDRITRQQRRRPIIKGGQRLLKANNALAERAALRAFREARGKPNRALSGPRATVFTPGWRRKPKGFDFSKTDLSKFLNASARVFA